MVEISGAWSSRASLPRSQRKRLLKQMKRSYKKAQGIQKKSDESHVADLQEAESYLDSTLSLSSGHDQ